MPKPKTATTELYLLASGFPALIDELGSQIDRVSRAMGALKKAGLIYASPHWRDGKYLYLLHPQQIGKPRHREYVGCDADRVAAAQAGIERAKQYDDLQRELAALQHKADKATDAFRAARYAFTGRGRW